MPGIGAHVEDLFYDEPRFLAAVALSENAKPGLTIGARIVCFPEFAMTTGAAFGVEPTFIDRFLAPFRDRGGFRQMMRSLDAAGRAKLTAELIRAVLGTTENDKEEALSQ